ncbi:unnamed protein product [Somion occarium]|uniref:Fcf2 pre-rRNA processing C-terminal domain-containing protein n=1 Tax=Somion occarium TaxID=3059160 RepID=A0ABP1DYB8_9APHY
MSVSSLDKGKGRELPTSYQTSSRSGTSSASGSDSESDSDRSSDESSSDEEITQEYLDSLLEKARQNAARSLHSKSGSQDDFADGDEVIRLNTDEDEEEQKPLPPLDPGSLPMTYIDVGDSSQAGPSKVRDLDVEQAEKSTSKLKAPDVSRPVPELSESGKLLTKKEKKAQKNKTAGPGWFDLPAPAEADLPKLYREVEALRLRNQLDPKRFYRKEEGEGKGVKGLPKHFAIGTIIPESTPFGTASGDNLSRSHRKRTLVDELVDDAEAKSYAKKKFKELQTVRGARGRGTLAAKRRKPKW